MYFSVPSEPMDLEVQATQPRTLTVTWSAPMPPNGPIILYIILYSAMNFTITKRANTSSTYHELTDLGPFTNYSVTVQACTEAGCGALTPPTVQLTQEEGINGGYVAAMSFCKHRASPHM